MWCHRCGGMMVYEKFYGDFEYFFGWNCVSCGEIIDRVILDNRRLPPLIDDPRSRAPRHYKRWSLSSGLVNERMD